MNYFFLYQTLKARALSEGATHSSDKRALSFSSAEFHSSHSSTHIGNCNLPFDAELSQQNANKDFSYPIVHPNGEQPSDGCIILLHGLNERTWDKYLPWAYQLANYTNKTVLLFPIAYHMNRSPKAWCDPRKMHQYVKQRYAKSPDVEALSVANVALSERLTNRPERFFLSGFQAANDLIKLVSKIKSGHFSEIKKDAQVDFFAYSIGAFLSQIMMMAYGDNLLSRSKLFIFCGGSAFDDWQGVSKYIMDSVAFKRLKHYYKFDVDQSHSSSDINNKLNNTALGESFRHMISLDNLKRKGHIYSSSLKDRIAAVVLKNDTVVNADKVKQAMKGIRVEEWDFNYAYSHIMPFPLLSDKLINQVNEAFDKLMLRASLLFTT